MHNILFHMTVFYSTKISKKGKNRLYCSNSDSCIQAEKALTDCGVHYVKLEYDENDPVLVTGPHTCNGLDEIIRYTIACSAIKAKYSVDWG